MGLEEHHLCLRVSFLREHTEKGYGTRGSGRVAERRVERNDSPSVQWGLVLRKILAMLQNPSPWLTPDVIPIPALVSPQMPCLPWSHLCLPPPTVSEAACQHQLSCWNLPSESSLSPWYSGCPAPAHLHSPDFSPAIPWYAATGPENLWFPTALYWLLWCPFCCAEYSPRCHLPSFLRPTHHSSCSPGLDLATPLLLHGSLPIQMGTPEDESRLDQAAWACCVALVNVLKLCPSASHSKASPRVLRSEIRGPFSSGPAVLRQTLWWGRPAGDVRWAVPICLPCRDSVSWTKKLDEFASLWHVDWLSLEGQGYRARCPPWC